MEEEEGREGEAGTTHGRGRRLDGSQNRRRVEESKNGIGEALGHLRDIVRE